MSNSTSNKIRLKETDWASLFPGIDYKIGETSFQVKPLSLKGLAFISGKLSTIGTLIGALAITANDLNPETRSIPAITDLITVILREAPEILAEMTGIHEDDIQSLPLSVAVDLFNTALDVNLNSQEDLIKNLKSLGEKFTKFLSNETGQEPLPATSQERARL